MSSTASCSIVHKPVVVVDCLAAKLRIQSPSRYCSVILKDRIGHSKEVVSPIHEVDAATLKDDIRQDGQCMMCEQYCKQRVVPHRIYHKEHYKACCAQEGLQVPLTYFW